MPVSTHNEQIYIVPFEVITNYLFSLARFKKDLIFNACFFKQILSVRRLLMSSATLFAGNNNMTFKLSV